MPDWVIVLALAFLCAMFVGLVIGFLWASLLVGSRFDQGRRDQEWPEPKKPIICPDCGHVDCDFFKANAEKYK